MLTRVGIVAINAILLFQTGGVLLSLRDESAPPVPPLRDLPTELGSWQAKGDVELDVESLRVLKPDDYLIRDYRSREGIDANLYVAYYRSQRVDRAPHSPQNCLPGNGWVTTLRDTMAIPTSPGEQFEVNRFVVERGENRSIVLYWYETPSKPVWSEFMGRFQLMMDSLRYNRSDTALIRIVLPIDSQSDETVGKAGSELALQVHPVVRRLVGMQ